jgi:hypothetical protein
MIIKAIGTLIFIAGFIFMLYTGLDFTTKEKVVDIGDFQITKDKDHATNWSPLFGLGAMVVGGVLFISGGKPHFKLG